MLTETKMDKDVIVPDTQVKVADYPYLIKFPVGDWSGDGHEKCDYFMVKSSHPVQDVREAHFSFKERFFDIGEMASEYGESSITPWIIDVMDEYAILEYILPLHVGGVEEPYEVEDTEEMCEIWLRCLMCANPDLRLLITSDEACPTVTFYGFDEQRRHLNSPGYGVHPEW